MAYRHKLCNLTVTAHSAPAINYGKVSHTDILNMHNLFSFMLYQKCDANLHKLALINRLTVTVFKTIFQL